jgi:4-amino-4-deoxy-L-arabinose transferase-like glycosyltransferase
MRYSDYRYILLLAASLWLVNAIWLLKDARPPVWDMAMHQSYALNFWPGDNSGFPPFQAQSRTGNYPPFVHLVIALFYLLFHPGPHVATLANIPATLLLLWGVYQLALDLAGRRAARWASFITTIIPYMMWLSRETVLDYWLAAWVVASLAIMHKTEGFHERDHCLILGFFLALGMLTKWLFAGFILFPLLYVFIVNRVWTDEERLVNLADIALIAGALSAVWYVPNLPRLIPYFIENSRIGAREGEPPVFSYQSWIYYLRLLEGYQLFAILFVIVLLSAYWVYRKRLLRDGIFLAVAITGGWLAMTLLRTKDARFTLPILGLLAIFPGAWIQSWESAWGLRVCKVILAVILCLQAYTINFGIPKLPQQVVLAEGYQGALRWDWNLYLQNYFDILGAPRREDWRQADILRRMAEDAGQQVRHSLALIPDLPRFSAANFQLYAKLLHIPARVDHLQAVPSGLHSFEGFDYVIMKEGDQGMPWSTVNSPGLNQIVLDEPRVFRLMELYELPNGESARLYAIRREEPKGQ